jgi:hypothetical protein
VAEDPEESEIGIGVPGDKRFPKRDFPSLGAEIPDRDSRATREIQSEPSICGTGGNHREPSAFSHRKSEFRRHRHVGIENPETTKGNQDRPSFEIACPRI